MAAYSSKSRASSMRSLRRGVVRTGASNIRSSYTSGEIICRSYFAEESDETERIAPGPTGTRKPRDARDARGAACRTQRLETAPEVHASRHAGDPRGEHVFLAGDDRRGG